MSGTVSMLGSDVDVPKGPCVFVSLKQEDVEFAASEARGEGQRARVVKRTLKVAGHNITVFCVIFLGLRKTTVLRVQP